MKRFKLLLTILVAMAMLLTGCGGDRSGANGGVQEASIAVYSTPYEPILDWDPSVCFSTDNSVFHNVYETLLYYDLNKDTFEPVLATEYSNSDDGLVWNFKLREGVKFHDGSDFTAEDVKFSIERTRDCKMGPSYMWDAVKEINIINDYEVELVLSYPDSIELVASCAYASFIMSSESVDADFKTSTAWFNEGKECGTGPYMLKSQTPGDKVILTKYDNYWKGWEGKHFTDVVFQYTSETAVRRQIMEGGEADVTYDLPALDVLELQKNDAIKVSVDNGLSDIIIFMNTSRAPLNDVNIRKACAYAFPYEDKLKYVDLGFATLATDVIPSTMWGANQKSPYYYDLDKAKEYLAAAGKPNGGFTLEFAYSAGSESWKKIAEMYKAELAKIGITLELAPASWDTNWTRAKSQNKKDRPDFLITMQWADLMSPAYAYKPMFHSEDTVNWNLSYYYNPKLDKLIDEAIRMTAIDKDKAAELYKQCGQIVAEDCVVLTGGDKKDIMIFNSGFEGYYHNAAYKGIVFFYDCSRAK